MGAAHILQVVDWSKYTLDEWLAQYGAWCASEKMKGGNCPNNLSVSQSYRLMQSAGSAAADKPEKEYPTCEISSDEARAVQRILLDAEQTSWILEGWIDLLKREKVKLKSVRSIAIELKVSRADVKQDIQCARAYLHGRYGFLKID